MLTRKQQELLLFIHERMRESGIPPSFDEMKDALTKANLALAAPSDARRATVSDIAAMSVRS